MYQAAHILIDALDKTIAADEAAADALFETAFIVAAEGNEAEAEATLKLSRMHRIKAIGLRCQVTVIRLRATLHFRNRKTL